MLASFHFNQGGAGSGDAGWLAPLLLCNGDEIAASGISTLSPGFLTSTITPAPTVSHRLDLKCKWPYILFSGKWSPSGPCLREAGPPTRSCPLFLHCLLLDPLLSEPAPPCLPVPPGYSVWPSCLKSILSATQLGSTCCTGAPDFPSGSQVPLNLSMCLYSLFPRG